MRNRLWDILVWLYSGKVSKGFLLLRQGFGSVTMGHDVDFRELIVTMDHDVDSRELMTGHYIKNNAQKP